MSAASYLRTPFVQPTMGTPMPKISSDAPQMIALPQAVGHGDNAMIFRSMLLRTQGDGCELRSALDQMVMVHPEVAAKIIAAGGLGGQSLDQAVTALRVYVATRVAQAPVMAL